MEKINTMLQRFWEVDTSGIEQAPLLNTEDKLVLDMAHESIRYHDCSYEIGVPWKDKSTVAMVYQIILKWQKKDYTI